MTTNAQAGNEPQSGRPNKRTSWRSLGCLVKPTMIAALAWAGGIYLMGRDSAGAAGRTAAVVLIVIATLFSLPLVVILFGMAAQFYFQRKIMGSLKEVLDPARETFERTKAIYGEPHLHRPASDAD